MMKPRKGDESDLVGLMITRKLKLSSFFCYFSFLESTLEVVHKLSTSRCGQVSDVRQGVRWDCHISTALIVISFVFRRYRNSTEGRKGGMGENFYRRRKNFFRADPHPPSFPPYGASAFPGPSGDVRAFQVPLCVTGPCPPLGFLVRKRPLFRQILDIYLFLIILAPADAELY